MRPYHSLFAVLLLLVAAGCDQPLPTDADGQAEVASGETGFLPSSQGMTVAPISGTIGIAGGEPPARVVLTPSGVFHRFDWPTLFQFAGDVTGLLTFHEQHHDMGFNDTMLIISGPFDGEVTWNGLTGPLEGRFKIECRADDTPPFPTCVTKVMSGTGAGDLEGVLFRFDVEPGWIPFAYSGSVFSR